MRRASTGTRVVLWTGTRGVLQTRGVTATSLLGRVLRDADGVRLEFVRLFDTPPVDVWSAVTDPELLGRWFGGWTGDPTTGTVLLTIAEEGAEPSPVTIDECDPPRRLAVTTSGPDGPWPLTVELDEQGAGTRLRFVHVLAEPDDAGSIGPGWQYYLDRLGAVLLDEPVPDDFTEYHPALAGAYAAPPAAHG